MSYTFENTQMYKFNAYAECGKYEEQKLGHSTWQNNFFSNGRTDTRTNERTDGRSDYIMPQIYLGA